MDLIPPKQFMISLKPVEILLGRDNFMACWDVRPLREALSWLLMILYFKKSIIRVEKRSTGMRQSLLFC